MTCSVFHTWIWLIQDGATRPAAGYSSMGLITRMPCTTRAKAASNCRGDRVPFGCRGHRIQQFHDTVAASALLYAVVCRGGNSTDRDRKRLNKLVRRFSPVLDCILDSIEAMGERMMLAKLTSTPQPLHHSGSLEQLFQQQTLTPTAAHSSSQPSDCLTPALPEQSLPLCFL